MKIGNWTPPQRPRWVKEIMKIPGTTKVQLSLLLILATSSVTSTVLQISNQGRSTLEGSISPAVESLQVGNEKLQVRVTGKSTTEVLKNLSPMLTHWGSQHLNER